jgi:FMN phosphatase YigB (HAD superfamily)
MVSSVNGTKSITTPLQWRLVISRFTSSSSSLQIYTSARDQLIYSHLYDDVIPCFRWLVHDEQLPIAILSNNTVNIPLGEAANHELGSLVTLSMNSADLGCKKPSLVSYLSVTQRLNAHPSRVLFIGDDHECDVVGPAGLGMKTGQLCRHLLSEEKERRRDSHSREDSTKERVQPDLLLTSLAVQEVV